MADKSNIELFDEITARVFYQLYVSFPIPLDIECRKLTDGNDLDDQGNIRHDIVVCGAALTWLRDEGFIKFKASGQLEAFEVVLTSQGLRALKSIPESLEGKTTIGDKLESAMKNGSISTGIEAVKLLLSAAV